MDLKEVGYNMAHLFPENFTSEGVLGRNQP